MADPQSKLDQALRAAALGIPVFRLRINGKKPHKGWQSEATTDSHKVRELWAEDPDANIGWAMGRGHVAIDVDIKKERQGDKSLFEFELKNGDLPDSLINVTATNGWHVILATDHKIGNDNTGKWIGRGVDVKGEGGYVVGAGSTIDGIPYRSEFERIAQAPHWLVALTTPPIEKQSDRPIADIDTDQAIERARQWLQQEAPPAIEGQGGDHTAFTVAAKLRDLAISEPQALDLMLEHWNELCTPPWDPEQLQQKVRNAYQYASRAPGNASAEADFETEQPKTPWPTPVAPFDFASLTPPDWLLGTLLARKYLSLLVAPPGAGKTKLTLLAAVALASGKGEVIGMKMLKGAQRVWMINGEDSMEDMHRNLAAAMTIANVTWDDFKDADGNTRLHINSGHEQRIQVARLDGSKRVTSADQPWLIERCKANRIDVLFIDPLIEFHPCNENDNGEMGAVASLVRSIAIQAECAVLLVHHTRKRDKAAANGMAGDMDSARGAGALIGAARIVKTFYQMEQKEQRIYGVTEQEARRLIKLTDAKSNIAAMADDHHWFRMRSVLVGGLDGFEVGAAESVTLRKGEVQTQALALGRAVLRVVLSGETAASASAIADRLRANDPMYAEMSPRTILREFKTYFEGTAIDVEGRTVGMDSTVRGVSARLLFGPLIPTQYDMDEGE